MTIDSSERKHKIKNSRRNVSNVLGQTTGQFLPVWLHQVQQDKDILNSDGDFH